MSIQTLGLAPIRTPQQDDTGGIARAWGGWYQAIVAAVNALIGLSSTQASQITALQGNFPDAAWQSWTPTVSPAGAMTVSGVTVNDAQYYRVGPICFFKVWVSFTLGGTAAASVTISLPFTAAGTFCTVAAQYQHPSSNGLAPACVSLNAGTINLFTSASGANWVLGSASGICEGFYRIS